MSEPLDAVAAAYDDIADELERAVAHVRVAAKHYRDGVIPRGAAHALSAHGHLLEAADLGALCLGDRRELAHVRVDHGRDERVLRREAPEHGAVPDAGSSRDLVDARIEAALRETLAGRLQQPVEVSLSVGTELHAFAATAPASMRAT